MLKLITFPHKIVVIALIFILFVSLFQVSFTMRFSIYELLKKGMQVQLDIQTRSFKSLESENFTLKYTEDDSKLAGTVLCTAEEAYQNIQDAMDIYLPSSKKTLVVLYPDTESLNKSIGLKGDKSAVGVYWAGSIRLLSPQAWQAQEMSFDTLKEVFKKEGPLAHELVHLLVDYETKGNYTRWFTEGLAQYIEEQTTGFRLAEPLEEDKKHPYPLTELDKDFDQKPNELLAYWQSLETVRYLINEFGMEKIKEFINTLGQGEKFPEAFQDVYGFSMSELEIEAKEWMIKESSK